MRCDGYSIGIKQSVKIARLCAYLGLLCTPLLVEGVLSAQVSLHANQENSRTQQNGRIASNTRIESIESMIRERILAFPASFYQYDVRAFGASGDDVTDDTTAVQMAINAAASFGGGVVYFPKGVYKVGELKMQPTSPRGCWMLLLMDGILHLTQTLELNTPAYALIGRSGGLFNAFQQYPSAAMKFDTNLSPIIHISADPIYLEGITLKYVRGDGILIDSGTSEVILKRVFIHSISNGSGSPVHVNMSVAGFGLVITESTFSAPVTDGTHAIELRNFGMVNIRDSFLINRGIFAAAPNAPQAGSYSFDNILYEDGLDPFLALDSTNSHFAGIDMENVEMADPAVQPNYLLVNNSSGGGYVTGVFLKFSRSNAAKLVGGNTPIYGLHVYANSDTDAGHLAFLGQNDFYTFYDRDGVSNIARLSVGMGGTIITKHLSALMSLTASSIAPQSQQEFPATVKGARPGDSCEVSPEAAPESNLIWSCYISSEDTITVRLVNPTTTPINPAARNWRINVWEHQ